MPGFAVICNVTATFLGACTDNLHIVSCLTAIVVNQHYYTTSLDRGPKHGSKLLSDGQYRLDQQQEPTKNFLHPEGGFTPGLGKYSTLEGRSYYRYTRNEKCSRQC